MIYDKIEHAARYKFPLAALNKAMEHLALGKSETGDLEFGRINEVNFQTSAVATKQAEYHREYIDIHVVLEGKEYVEVGHIGQLTNCTPFDEQNDFGLGDLNTESKFQGYLSPQYFLICFPEDAHLVGAHVEEPEHVRKLVYKVPVQQIE